MRSALSLVAVASASVFVVAARATADGPAARPQGVVYLQRSAVFDVPYGKDKYSCYRGPLLREVQRQALLVAARDQLGLITRDAWLGDWMPAAGDNEPFEVVMSGNPPALEVRRGFYPAKNTLLKHVPKIGAISYKALLGSEPTEMIDHRQWLVDAELLSRTAYVEALEKCGFQGKANELHDGRGVPEEIEKNLAEMVFTSQFIAVRRLHELLRTDGESPARLGALVRGYANLGVLTEFHWHPEHKVFKARALLYAQRMVARNAQSPEALWHRAYALALTGLHLPAMEDLAAAEKAWKEANEDNRGVRPGWVDLIDALCRFDSKRLERRTGRRPAVAVGPPAAVPGGGDERRADDESGDGLGDSAQNAGMLPRPRGGVRLSRRGHGAPRDYRVVPDRRADALPAAGGHAGPARAGGQDCRGHRARRAGSGHGRGIPNAGGGDAGAAGERQTAAGGRREEGQAGHASADGGEPSWAALGLMIRELSFVQVWRRADFEMNILGMLPSQLKTLSAPLVAGHPYADFIETFTNDHRVRHAAWDRLRTVPQDGLEVQEFNICDTGYRITRPDEDERFMQLVNTRIDLTANDISHELRLEDDGTNPQCVFTRSTERLLVVSPDCPYGKAIAIDWFADKFRKFLPEWEKAAEGHPRLCRSLADYYARNNQNWREVTKWAKAALDANPDLDAAQLLGTAYWYQGKKEQWVSTLEEALNYADYALVHGQVCEHLARYFMSQKDWDKAMIYAEGAGATGSVWGLNLTAEILEGTRHWKEAEEMRRRATGDYSRGSLGPYFFCRRTGHGDVDAARTASKAEIASWDYPQRDPEKVAVFHILEKNPKEAAKFMGEAYRRFHRYTFGLRLVLLQDELKDAKARDGMLKTLLAIKLKATWPDTQQAFDGITGLTRMIADDLAKGGKGELDLAAADRACEALAKSLDAPPGRHNNLAMIYNYVLGRYLSLHGKDKEAIGYWRKCVADTEDMDDTVRTLAAVELYDRGIKPESYKALWEKGAEAKDKDAKAKEPS